MSTRVIHEADALSWLAVPGCLDGASVITSLPDVGELGLEFSAWKTWFVDAAALVMSRVPDEGVAIFFQSDIRHGGWWVDKGFLVAQAAERVGFGTLFHRVVCRRPAGNATFGRASYSHLLGFSRVARATGRLTTDVLPATGFKPGQKSMGVAACRAACEFVLAETSTRMVVDPFCGYGTVLAVANALGLDAIGVDLSSRMCRTARALSIAAEEL